MARLATAFPGAQVFLPKQQTFPRLREALQTCEGCDLFRHATQGVFGEGPATTRLLFIGEQPGNEEDVQGRPFVGPAGRILDKALEEAGINRKELYVTNAVKHFKFEERGKRRLHKKPSSSEVNACRPWLEAEVQLVKPRIIVCLGATAAQSLLGSKFRLTQDRGNPIAHPWAQHVVATIHPSAILRIPDSAERHSEFERLVADFRKIRALLK
jgi:uracil-DNA glycosylase